MGARIFSVFAGLARAAEFGAADKKKGPCVHQAPRFWPSVQRVCGQPYGARPTSTWFAAAELLWTPGGARPDPGGAPLPVHAGARDPRKPLYTPTLSTLGHGLPLCCGGGYGVEKMGFNP